MPERWERIAPGIRCRIHPTKKHGVKLDRYFVLRFTVDGQKRQEALGWASDGWTLAKAQTELSRLKEAARTGTGPVTLAEKRQVATEHRRLEAELNITLGDYWANHYEPYAKQEKRPETWRGEEKGYRVWLKDPLGKRPLRSIQPRDLEDIRKGMREARKAPRTIQHVFSTFRAVWVHGKKWGIVEGEPPTVGVELGRIDNARHRFLSAAQLQALLAEVERRDPNAWEFVLAAAHTGARLSELASLSWGSVDMEQKTLILIHTKTGKPRAFPMTPQLASMLKGKTIGEPGELVFKNSKGRRWKLMPTCFRKSLVALGFNDGREDRREIICFHSLRHGAASFLLAAGVDVRTIQELFGWSTLAMLQRYTHPGSEAKARAVAALGAAVDAKGGKVVSIRKKAQGQ
jgi:integrase